jgi:calcineurin-like phosphoesterase family protein
MRHIGGPGTSSSRSARPALIHFACTACAIAALVVMGSCGGGGGGGGGPANSVTGPQPPGPPLPPPPPPPLPGGSAILVGAGDIAKDGDGADATARLLDGIPGTVFTAGDNAYSDGTAADFLRVYDPTWGRHRARTRPAPGNHEYNTPGAGPYYSYFGDNAGPAGRGYYSYDLGDWHIISLNSNIDMSAGSPQEQWLRADLAANAGDCTLAYWHHPRFSSGTHGSSIKSQAIWQALYDAGAEIVISAHDHNYQRFAPQTPDGRIDAQRGLREFVVGTGGNGHYVFGSPIANTEAYNYDTYGVLKLTLSPGAYAWEFVPVTGATYRDTGSGTCH